MNTGGGLIYTGTTASPPKNPPTGSLMYDRTSGHMLVWTGSQWMTVHANPNAPQGANFKNATIVLMNAKRLADEDRIKHWKVLALYAVVGFILGRLFVVALEIIANHYLS